MQQIKDNTIIIDDNKNQDKKSSILSFHKISALHASIFLYCIVIIITAVVCIMTGVSYKVFEVSIKDNYKKKTDLLQTLKSSNEDIQKSIKDIEVYNKSYLDKQMQQNLIDNIDTNNTANVIKEYILSSNLITDVNVQIEKVNTQNRFTLLNNMITRFGEYNHNIQFNIVKAVLSGNAATESMVFNIIDNIKQAYNKDFVLIRSVDIKPIKDKELLLFNAYYYGNMKNKNDFNNRISFEISIELYYLTKEGILGSSQNKINAKADLDIVNNTQSSNGK